MVIETVQKKSLSAINSADHRWLMMFILSPNPDIFGFFGGFLCCLKNAAYVWTYVESKIKRYKERRNIRRQGKLREKNN